MKKEIEKLTIEIHYLKILMKSEFLSNGEKEKLNMILSSLKFLKGKYEDYEENMKG